MFESSGPPPPPVLTQKSTLLFSGALAMLTGACSPMLFCWQPNYHARKIERYHGDESISEDLMIMICDLFLLLMSFIFCKKEKKLFASLSAGVISALPDVLIPLPLFPLIHEALEVPAIPSRLEYPPCSAVR